MESNSAVLSTEVKRDAPMSIFGDSHQAAFGQMMNIVRDVASKLNTPKYVSQIQGKPYPKVEWWSVIGNVLGIFPSIVSTERVEDEHGLMAYQSICELRDANGRLFGRGKALCSRSEKRWASADEYAVQSMAETRSTGKAWRLSMPALAAMSGLEGTNAEEMPSVPHQEKPRAAAPARVPVQPRNPPVPAPADAEFVVIDDEPVAAMPVESTGGFELDPHDDDDLPGVGRGKCPEEWGTRRWEALKRLTSRFGLTVPKGSTAYKSEWYRDPYQGANPNDPHGFYLDQLEKAWDQRSDWTDTVRDIRLLEAGIARFLEELDRNEETGADDLRREQGFEGNAEETPF